MTDIKHWYAVYTKPRWEKKVFGLFREKKIEAYCPLNKVRRKWSDRIKIIEQPLFTSYVFVRVGNEELGKVRMVNGVVNFVYWGGKPAIVKDAEIDVIKKFLNEYENVEAQPIELRPEMNVKIQRGVFMDHEAKVLKIEGNRVQVNIESIGYSLIAFIDRSNVAAI